MTTTAWPTQASSLPTRAPGLTAIEALPGLSIDLGELFGASRS
jgi:hypothetical protein